MDETDVWTTSMAARGYVQGPKFSSYEELIAWEPSNTRPHLRRTIAGICHVYFTDAQSLSAEVPTEPKNTGPDFNINDVPF